MTTKAATFTAKIKALTDFHNMIAARSVAVPHGSDVANSLKYFYQTLLGILRDVPALPREMYGPKQTDAIRLSIFPNLAYSALFNAVIQIVDDLPFFQQGLPEVSEALLNILACLPPFLEFDLVDAIVYTLSCSYGYFPQQHHQKLIELICHNLLPVTLGFSGEMDEPIYTAESTSTIILSVFQHTENRGLHSKITEAIMSFKEDVYKDLFIVAAYGPPQARLAACCLVFHYWPNIARRALLSRGPSLHYKYTVWQSIICERPSCLNAGNAAACKMILEPSVCLSEVSHPPPLFVCENCYDQMRSRPDRQLDLVLDVISPVTSTSLKCQHPSCQNAGNADAIVTCFSANCTSALKTLNNSNQLPQAIRLCSSCTHRIHDAIPGDKAHPRHVVQSSIPMLWECDLDLQNYIVDAIVASLREAQIVLEYDPASQRQARAAAAALPSSSAVAGALGDKDRTDNFTVEDHLLLSRYGVWLLMEIADISKMTGDDTNNLSEETIGRLVAMVFQWFNATAYLPDVPEQTSNALESLKQDHIKAWIQAVMKRYENIVVSCLLPQPPDYARVGRAWEFITSRVQQIKHGLNCLFCLMPYDLVTFEVWDVVIPYWLEAVQSEVPEGELPEFKFFLSKMFNIDFGTLPFSVDQMFQFVSERFERGSLLVQEQALRWLQILTSMSITIPLSHLTKMFKLSVASICAPNRHTAIHYVNDDPKNIPLTVIQKMSADHAVILAPYDPSILEYYRFESTNDTSTQRKIEDVDEFKFYLLNLMLEVLIGQMELAEVQKHESAWGKSANSILPCLIGMIEWEWCHQPHGPGGSGTNPCHICERCGDFLQTFSRVLRWLCDRQPAKILKFEFVDYTNNPQQQSDVAAEPNVPASKAKAVVPQAPRLLECFIDKFVTSLTPGASSSIGISSIGGSASIIWRLLDCLQLLIAHDDSLRRYAALESCKENAVPMVNRFLPKLWQVLDASHAEIPRCAVACIMRCLTMADECRHSFDIVVKRDFSNSDWLCRFDAVERAVNLCQLVRFEDVVKNQQLLSCLALVSYHLALSIRDLNLTIVQRATILLGTLQSNSIKTVVESLLFQFRFCINDRLTVLDTLSILSATLQSRHTIITWDLVFQFMDALVAEIQANSDLLDPLEIAEHDNRLDRARYALSHPSIIRSLQLPLSELMASDSGSLVTTKSGSVSQLNRQTSSASITKKQFLTADLVFQKHISPPSSFDSSLVQASFRTFETHKQRREVMHRTLTFLMRFMSDLPRESARDRSIPVPGTLGNASIHHTPPAPRDNFHDSKTQNSLFRLLHHLLGYNPTVRTIVVEPERFRRSVVFNAFMGQLPALIDRNLEISKTLMPAIIVMLQHCCVSSSEDTNRPPTLAPLHHFVRRDWLIALTALLYKYDYNTEQFLTDGIVSLMTIVIATLHSATHDCLRAHSMGDHGFHAAVSFQTGLKRSTSLTNFQHSASWSSPEPDILNVPTPSMAGLAFGIQQTAAESTSAHSSGPTKSTFSLFPRGPKKGGLKDILVEATKASSSMAKASAASAATAVLSSTANDDSEAAIARRRSAAACSICGEPILSMSPETVGLCIVSLCAFVHREPSLAAPLLLDALQIVARVAVSFQFFWQKEDVYVHVPGNCVSIARQFLRLTLCQLQPNGIAPLLFASRISRPRQFFSVLSSALHDYHDLTNGALLLDLVKNLNAKKSLTIENIDQTLANMDVYLSNVTNENILPPEELDIQVPQLLTKLCMSPPVLQAANRTLFNILGHMFRLLHPIASRDLLDAACKLVSAILHEPNSSVPAQAMVTLFNSVCRCYAKERDRRVFIQFVCSELLHVIRCTGAVNYANAVCLLLFVSLDACRIIPPLTSHLDNRVCDPSTGVPLDAVTLAHGYAGNNSLNVAANVADLLKPYLTDLLAFLTDLHTIVNIKSALKGLDTPLLEDVGGGYVKAIVAQVSACLLADATAADPRSLGRHLPWIVQNAQNSSPDVMKQFSETLEHIRCLSWLLIGALTQMALTARPCQPIGTDLHSRVSDQILLVLSSYVDHETASVSHMTALFHAFLLCELWTLYVEQLVVYSPTSPSPLSGTGHICQSASEFWAKVTPTLIHLFSVTGERLTARLTELFTLHFVNLIESLQRARSSTLASLLPLWAPILFSAFSGSLSGNTNVRLQTILSWTPPSSSDVLSLATDREIIAPSDSAYNILACLAKLRFKLSQIEVQSSAAVRLYRV